MNPRQLAVFGGNGFVGQSPPCLSPARTDAMETGSAICRSAVARGWKVISLSRTGQPYATAQGHSPAWVTKVSFHPFSPRSVVHFSSMDSRSIGELPTLLIRLLTPSYYALVPPSYRHSESYSRMTINQRGPPILSVCSRELPRVCWGTRVIHWARLEGSRMRK